ncbi:MAG: Lrp/AsnC family transcriptional regulator [Solirubrobacterales bacterium]
MTAKTDAPGDGTKPIGSGRGQPKLRERKDGAAVPLDERDKQLLNLLQSSFPITDRPFDSVAAEMNAELDWVLRRTRELLDDRIIRELTPIFDTRALGYQSMLVAASVDPENPHRAAKIINEHPGVSHNYLRNHAFNLWFTIATPPDSKLGLEGTLDILARESGATSVRQLPTLKLFKINMNLEMEAGTETLAAPGGESAERPLGAAELSELDYAVIEHLQGRLPVVAEPYAPAAAAIGITTEQLFAHCNAMIDRGLLRRVAAILFHRRAGFSANGMGVWKVPEDQIATIGPRMASFRGISHCYQRPTYEDWPYSVFTMAHGRSKEECDEILDQIAEDTGIHERSTLYSSTEFKKIRLRYFTPEYAEWEARWL